MNTWRIGPWPISCLILALVCHAQENAKSSQLSRTAISIQLDQNPFRKTPTIAARIALVDRASPSLGWFQAQGTQKVDGKFVSYFKHDSILRILNLPREEAELLDGFFKARIDAHELNIEKLKGPSQRERELELAKHGAPPALLKFASLPELGKEEIDTYLIEYAKSEREAEKKLVDKLDELLPPSRFAVLVHEWWNVKLLYIPIVAKYLDLSDDQVKEIEASSLEAYKLQLQIRESYRGPDYNEVNKLLLSNSDWHESIYRPFASLTPSQFRIASKGLLKSWKSSPSFSEKLDALNNDSSLQAKAELKILGELYRQGVKLEQKE